MLSPAHTGQFWRLRLRPRALNVHAHERCQSCHYRMQCHTLWCIQQSAVPTYDLKPTTWGFWCLFRHALCSWTPAHVLTAHRYAHTMPARILPQLDDPSCTCNTAETCLEQIAAWRELKARKACGGRKGLGALRDGHLQLAAGVLISDQVQSCKAIATCTVLAIGLPHGFSHRVATIRLVFAKSSHR